MSHPQAPKKCVVHAVHVGGPSVQITCLKWISCGEVAAFWVGEDRCAGGSGIYKLEVDDYYNGAFCFDGSGYLGLGDPGGLGDIYNTTAVQSQIYGYDLNNHPEYGSGWVLYYSHGIAGKYYYANGNKYDCSNSPFCGHTDLTQVYLN
ncbi:MAG TPA: hypothetical protein VIC85_14960 [Ktedonobacterales bacterium]